MKECHQNHQDEDGPKLLWHMAVDAEKCSLCEVCARHCKPGALWLEQTGETGTLLFNEELCNGCGDCVKACPEQSMTLVASETASAGSGREVLAAGQLLRCAVCGYLFTASARIQAASRRRDDGAALLRDQCPLCRRTQMVARFIEERREAKGKPAEYRTGRKWRWKPIVEGDQNGPPCPESLREDWSGPVES